MNRKKQILVIEDEQDYRNIVMQLLEKEGFAVLCAENGADGLRFAAKNLPDLIILDIGLPDISGIEVCAKLKADKLTSKIPIMLFTIRSELDLVSQGLSNGAVGYVLKPFDFEEFNSRIKELTAK